MKRIDLNCDMGELPAAIADGTQEALMPSFTSANVAWEVMLATKAP